MAGIRIYTRPWCGFCHRAKALLESKRAEYQEIDIEGDSALVTEMVERAGRTSVPQIFVADRHIGGYDDLRALELEGELDGILGD